MPAGKLDITLEQGTTFRRAFTIREGGVAKDLSAYTIAAQARVKPSDSTPLITFAISATSLVTGQFELWASASAMAALPTYDPPARLVGYWDLELTDGSGVVTRLLEGRAIVTPEMTK